MTRSCFSRLVAATLKSSQRAETITKPAHQQAFARFGTALSHHATTSTTTRRYYSQQKQFSSAVPEPMYTEEEPSSSEDTNHPHPHGLPQQHPEGLVDQHRRPRLTELRRKLWQEENKKKGATSASGVTPALSKPKAHDSKVSLRLPNKNNQDDTTTTTTATYTRDDWLTLVDLLPDPPAADAALTDRFHRPHTYLRLSLAERCNLRCTYCMPADGVPLQPASHLLQTDELLHLATFFRNYGVNKFRLTGGEPTLRKDLLDVVAGLKALEPRQIGMTTNGVALASKIPALVDEGLDSLNLSLDTLDPQKFERLTRRPATYLQKVYEALEACYQHMPASQIKINCVLMRDVNTEEVVDFIQLGLQRFPGIAVRFIEYMPFTDNGWELDKLVPYKEVVQEIDDAAARRGDWQMVKVPQTDPHDTTQWYKASSSSCNDVRHVNVGFITSMSRPFCAGCNRLRLSADGQLKVCLFGSTQHEQPDARLPSLWSLRDALRVGQLDDTQLSKLVHAALLTKSFALGGHDSPQTIHEHSRENKPMTLIGG